MEKSSNRRVRTKKTKERGKVDIVKLKYHTANLYKKAFQLALIDSNYEIKELDCLKLKNKTVMSVSDKVLYYLTCGRNGAAPVELPKIQSIWQQLDLKKPMNFSMPYFETGRKRKPLVKQY